MFPTELLPVPFNIFERLKFWVLFVALSTYVITFFVPDFPLSEDVMLQVVLGVLALFGIHAEVKARAITKILQREGFLYRPD